MASGVAACIARMRSSECGRRELRMTTAVGAYTRTEKPPPLPLWEWSHNLHNAVWWNIRDTHGLPCMCCKVRGSRNLKPPKHK